MVSRKLPRERLFGLQVKAEIFFSVKGKKDRLMLHESSAAPYSRHLSTVFSCQILPEIQVVQRSANQNVFLYFPGKR